MGINEFFHPIVRLNHQAQRHYIPESKTVYFALLQQIAFLQCIGVKNESFPGIFLIACIESANTKIQSQQYNIPAFGWPEEILRTV